MWLEPIEEILRKDAQEALEAKNVIGFLRAAPNGCGLALVWHNAAELLRRGLYEKALVEAYIGTRTNNAHWRVWQLKHLFDMADPTRLRAVGSPLPWAGPFTLYRGVIGRGRARRVCGMSWTPNRDVAAWFAWRYVDSLPDPAVYTVVVKSKQVLVYLTEREEDEYLVDPQSVRPIRLPDDGDAERAKRYQSEIQAANAAFLAKLRKGA